jgi:plastocyanin
MSARRLRGALSRGAAVLAAVAFAACGPMDDGPPAPVRHDVAIGSFRFEPAEVIAAPGDSIVWTNHDFFPHTVTFGNGAVDSGNIEPGASWTWVVPAAGGGEYLCSFHPMMTGSVVGPTTLTLEERHHAIP